MSNPLKPLNQTQHEIICDLQAEAGKLKHALARLHQLAEAAGGSAMNTKLERCPFCGSSKVYVRFYNQPSVCCEECLCMGPASQRLTKDNKSECQQEAVLRWNKRVDYRHKITLENTQEAAR